LTTMPTERPARPVEPRTASNGPIVQDHQRRGEDDLVRRGHRSQHQRPMMFVTFAQAVVKKPHREKTSTSDPCGTSVNRPPSGTSVNLSIRSSLVFCFCKSTLYKCMYGHRRTIAKGDTSRNHWPFREAVFGPHSSVDVTPSIASSSSRSTATS
jgi:hypothetical protein